MIILVGANAALTKELIPYLDFRELIVIGRNRPQFLDHAEFNNRRIEFIHSNYSDAEAIAKQIASHKDLTLIFIGIGTEPTLIKNISPWQLGIDLEENLEFPTLLVKNVLLAMIRDSFGRFIFIGSKESTRGVVGGSVYAMIKTAQMGLSRTIAVEYAKFGITSNVLQLGLLDFGYSKKIPKRTIDSIKSRIPTNTSLEPKDIAVVITALIEASSVNGAVIDIDQSVR